MSQGGQEGGMPEISIGQSVRSFDFEFVSRDIEGENACYVEGKVVDIVHKGTCRRYKIEIHRRVLCGKTVRQEDVGMHMYPPINGTPRIDGGVCNGVEPL